MRRNTAVTIMTIFMTIGIIGCSGYIWHYAITHTQGDGFVGMIVLWFIVLIIFGSCWDKFESMLDDE